MTSASLCDGVASAECRAMSPETPDNIEPEQVLSSEDSCPFPEHRTYNYID